VAARDGGILKVFLRVEADSAPELAARRVGFHQYARDLVYRLSDMTSRPALTATTLHARRRVHHHAIFQLYSAVVPIEVREMEGMTLQEWRLADGWGFRPAGLRVHLSQRRRDFVLERDGKVVLWSCIDQQSRHVQLTAQGDEPADVVREALRHGLAQLPFGGAVTCAVRSYQPSLLPLLEGEGFVLRAEHALLGQSLTVRVPQRQFVPARA
jgi:hypothetical protein